MGCDLYNSTPTHSEYQSLPRIKLTSQDLEWDPQNPEFSAQENMFFNHFGEFDPPGDMNSANRWLLKSTTSLVQQPHRNGKGHLYVVIPRDNLIFHMLH